MVNLPIEYSDKHVNPFGGINFLKRFVDQTGIIDYLEELDLSHPDSNRGYAPQYIIESFWLSICTGASRYIHCDCWRYDQTFQSIFEWDKMLFQFNYSGFYGKFNQSCNTEVFPKLQQWFFDQLEVDNITIDFDSIVITGFCDQRGSEKGYNPNNRERNSQYPLLTVVSQTLMVANVFTADNSSCKAFMQEKIDKVLKEKRNGLVRADSGFYNKDLLDYLVAENYNYTMAVPIYSNIKNAVWGLDQWLNFNKEINLNKMMFSPTDTKPRRYIIMRKRIEDRSKAIGKILFDDLLGYRFSYYGTNMELPLHQIWNFCNSKAGCENKIKELIGDIGLENFCLQDFWVTEVSFRFIMVAYNLMNLCWHFALNHYNRAILKTLRIYYCFAVRAWQVNHTNKRLLKIALQTKRRPWMDGIFAQIMNSSPSYEYFSTT